MIKRAFIESWKNLRLTILWPIILTGLSAVIFSFLFTLTTGIWQFLISQPLPVGQKLLFEVGFEIANLLRENIVRVVISFIIFFTLYFVVGSSLLAMRLGILKDITEGKKQGIFKGFINAIPYYRTKFWPVVWTRAISFLITIPFTAVILILSFNLDKVSTILRALLIILIALISLILGLILLFRYAYLLLKDQGAWESIRSSVRMFIRNPLYSLGVFAIIFSLSFIRDITQIIPKPTSLVVPIGIIIAVYTILLMLWQELFVFYSLKLRQPSSLKRRKR